MDERTEVHRYVNTCPDDQMHESVTHRCTVCGQPFHENTADLGRALCFGRVWYHDENPDHGVERDSRHEPAGLRPIIRTSRNEAERRYGLLRWDTREVHRQHD